MSTKLCTKCGEDRELYEFSKASGRKDGLKIICKVCDKEYYQANKEAIAVRMAEYYQANKENILTQTAVYYQNNKVQKAEYQQTNKEAIAVRMAEYNQTNKEARAVYMSEYLQTPKGKLSSKNSNHKRRALVKSGSISTEELEKLIEDNTECFYCGCDITDVNRHIDHFIPLSKGGLHDLQNLVVACATCNMKKGDKMPEEFMARQLTIKD